MASRLMHLYVGKALADKLDIKDKNRFFCGIVLPDALLTGSKAEYNTHYVIQKEGRKTMDFGKFYAEYKDKIHTDELYLGYFFHLVSDCAYRKFIYYTLNLLRLRSSEDFLDKLYSDFHGLNTYISEKTDNFRLFVPDSFEKEDINKICNFQLKDFLKIIEKDYFDNPSPVYHFISPEICEEYFSYCLECCIKEYEQITLGKPLDAWEYSWENPPI